MANTTAEATRRWRALDDRHHLHPFTSFPELKAKGSRVIVGAKSCHIEDSEGNRILDGMSGLWCVNLGYGQKRLAAAAAEQMARLPYYNTFFMTTTPAIAELSGKLASLLPDGIDRLMFMNSGSEANDTVIKTVWYYWNLMDRPEKKVFISRSLGYHGVSLGSASLTGMTYVHKPFNLPLPGFAYIGNPYHFAEGGDEDLGAFGLRAAGWLEDKILEIGPDKVAAFVAEPLQGAGGVIIPPKSYWPKVQEICRRYDVLLVADEVICGFGRTGNWWGSETFAIEPDIVVMAKGITSGYVPLAAVALGPRVGDVVAASEQEYAHGVTWAGHPVAAAVANETIAIMEEEGLATRASGPIADYFADRLMTLADHPLVGEVRSQGLIACVELVEDKAAKRPYPSARKVGLTCRENCFKNGLVMRAIRDGMVLSPPLIITEAEIDEIVTKAAKSFDQTLAGLAA